MPAQFRLVSVVSAGRRPLPLRVLWPPRVGTCRRVSLRPRPPLPSRCAARCCTRPVPQYREMMGCKDKYLGASTVCQVYGEPEDPRLGFYRGDDTAAFTTWQFSPTACVPRAEGGQIFCTFSGQASHKYLFAPALQRALDVLSPAQHRNSTTANAPPAACRPCQLAGGTCTATWQCCTVWGLRCVNNAGGGQCAGKPQPPGLSQVIPDTVNNIPQLTVDLIEPKNTGGLRECGAAPVAGPPRGSQAL